ncbi:hypothetical protein [Siccirubricoccus phaeus]|nr:hypothetical protein [Siccirubricoccus phaeus]
MSAVASDAALQTMRAGQSRSGAGGGAQAAARGRSESRRGWA